MCGTYLISFWKKVRRKKCSKVTGEYDGLVKCISQPACQKKKKNVDIKWNKSLGKRIFKNFKRQQPIINSRVKLTWIGKPYGLVPYPCPLGSKRLRTKLFFLNYRVSFAAVIKHGSHLYLSIAIRYSLLGLPEKTKTLLLLYPFPLTCLSAFVILTSFQ